jgi:hypothetical protein
MTDPYARTAKGMFDRIFQRIAHLEARIARILPGRLSSGGLEVTDWDHATQPGFYWGTDALHAPKPTGIFVGIVSRSETRIVQEIWNATITDGERANTWRRQYASGAWDDWGPVGVGFFMAEVTNAMTPGDYPYGYSYGYSSTTLNGFPNSLGTVETTISVQGSRAVQRFISKGDDSLQRTWRRGGIDSSTWGPWIAEYEDTGWTTPTFVNDFTNGSNVGYRRLNGVTYLRGELLRTTAPATSTTAFVLPAGFRPATRARVVNFASSGDPTQAVFLTANSNGNVDVLCSIARSATPGYNLATSFPADN